jgi:hypothetical protein
MSKPNINQAIRENRGIYILAPEAPELTAALHAAILEKHGPDTIILTHHEAQQAGLIQKFGAPISLEPIPQRMPTGKEKRRERRKQERKALKIIRKKA